MSLIKRDDAIPLISFFSRVVQAGTRTSHYPAYNAFATFILRDCPHAYADVPEWDIPGLFIADTDLLSANKPYVTIVYQMKCGHVLALTLPRTGCRQVPSGVNIVQHNAVLNGENGFKVAIGDWHIIGNTNDIVIKRGKHKRAHAARKPRTE